MILLFFGTHNITKIKLLGQTTIDRIKLRHNFLFLVIILIFIHWDHIYFLYKILYCTILFLIILSCVVVLSLLISTQISCNWPTSIFYFIRVTKLEALIIRFTLIILLKLFTQWHSSAVFCFWFRSLIVLKSLNFWLCSLVRVLSHSSWMVSLLLVKMGILYRYLVLINLIWKLFSSGFYRFALGLHLYSDLRLDLCLCNIWNLVVLNLSYIRPIFDLFISSRLWCTSSHIYRPGASWLFRFPWFWSITGCVKSLLTIICSFRLAWHFFNLNLSLIIDFKVFSYFIR